MNGLLFDVLSLAALVYWLQWVADELGAKRPWRLAFGVAFVFLFALGIAVHYAAEVIS